MLIYRLVIHCRDATRDEKLCNATDLESACTELLTLADDLALAPTLRPGLAVIGIDLCDSNGDLLISVEIMPGVPLAGAATRLAKRA